MYIKIPVNFCIAWLLKLSIAWNKNWEVKIFFLIKFLKELFMEIWWINYHENPSWSKKF